MVVQYTYRIAGNVGGKNVWRIALIMAFAGSYFGNWVSLIRTIIIFIAKW